MNTSTSRSSGGTGNWEAKKENFKAKFPVLTDDDLNFEINQKDQMFERLKTILGMNSDELHITIITL